MEIHKTHQIDQSNPDEEEGYYYEYDLYRFSENSLSYVARSYVDEPNDVHFLRKEINGEYKALLKTDFEHPLFKQAIDSLHKEGKKKIFYLSGSSYELLEEYKLD